MSADMNTMVGVTAYRLRNTRSADVIGEWAESRPPFVAALEQVAGGIPPDALAMDIRIRLGPYGHVSDGLILVGLAQAALGFREAAAGARRGALTRLSPHGAPRSANDMITKAGTLGDRLQDRAITCRHRAPLLLA
jgi:hypothetical protein